MSNKRMTAVWDKSLQKGTKLLALLSLADRADDDGHCWPSHTDTAKRTRSIRSYVHRMLTDIEADGELYIHRRPGKSHRYLVIVGMDDDEIRAAMGRRFNYSDTEIDEKIEEIHRCLQNGHVRSTDTTCTVKRTPPVRSAGHEPSRTPNKTEPSNKKSATRKRDARLDHPAVITYREVAHFTAPPAARDDLCKVSDVDHWRDVVKTWIKKGWNPRNIDGMLDVYKNGFKQDQRKGSEVHSPRPVEVYE